jgi:diaminopimelate decarboxylase
MLYPFIGYKNGRLFVEDTDVSVLAEKIGTPFYCYSSAAMRSAYENLAAAIDHPRVRMHYAVKACSNLAVIKLLAGCGAGMDIVSIGEFKRCLAAGVKPGHVVFSGVGKTDEEIEFALKNGVGQFNVESIPEIDAIARIAGHLKTRAPVALRINPEVGAGGHDKISTGREEDKFGVNWEQVEGAYAHMAGLPTLQALGLTCHIGSQITEVQPFIDAAARVEEMVGRLRHAGHTISRISLGGGLGISYQGESVPVTGFGKLVHDFAERMGCDIELEPGRHLVGEAAILVSKVIFVKHGTAKDFLVIDAAMNDLIRPTLYEAYHPIVPVVEKKDAPLGVYDVVGPVCETGDYLALDRQLPACHAGDHIALLCAGAYGATMASTYNSRALCPEVLISGVKFATVRARLTIEQQLVWETMPEWL